LLRRRRVAPNGLITYAEVAIGDSLVFVSDEITPSSSPLTSTIHLQVDNVDGVFQRAVKAGATIHSPLADMFWGDRMGKVEDPFGNHWSVGQHMRDVSHDEIEKQQENFYENVGTGSSMKKSGGVGNSRGAAKKGGAGGRTKTSKGSTTKGSTTKGSTMSEVGTGMDEDATGGSMEQTKVGGTKSKGRGTTSKAGSTSKGSKKGIGRVGGGVTGRGRVGGGGGSGGGVMKSIAGGTQPKKRSASSGRGGGKKQKTM
jgi:uncharacterized glyoxalase superfamily protein PhnB